MTGRDGVVKFLADHVDAPLPPHACLEALMALRDELHALGLIGVSAQGVGYGNASIRHKGTSFIISGSKTGCVARLTKSGYCLVEACDVPGNRIRSSGPVAASSESLTHYAVYAASAAAACVLHVHSRALFDQLAQSSVPATPPDAAYGTPAMAEAVFHAAKGLEQGIIVMSGHDEGLLAFGPDCPTARAALLHWLN